MVQKQTDKGLTKMKTIDKIEKVKNMNVLLEDVGINRTFYWAYIRTQETTNENLDFEDVKLGDSIACNGVCLTVVEFDKNQKYFCVDASPETFRCTVGLENIGGVLNLEKALRVDERLGGHIVSGHVDGVGEVIKFDAIGDNRLLEIAAPQDLAKYIARKGSITINGVSLTTNVVENNNFQINLIAHTLENTTLHTLAPGKKVNLEVDVIARYCERLLAEQK